MNLLAKDIETLRELASRYMTYALSEKNDEKRQLWKKLNALNMQKPMVTIHQIPWHEMDVDGFLRCTVSDPYFRGVENELRRQIYKWEHMPADMVLNPYINLPRPVHNTGFGLSIKRTGFDPGQHVESFLFEDQLAEEDDVAKILNPHLTLDRDEEAEILSVAEKIFDDIAPVRLRGIMLHSGLWDQITFWKGVENCYIDLLDRPELIHSILTRYTDAFLSQIDQINSLGVYDVTSNECHCSHTHAYSPLREGADCEHPTTYDGWTFSMAQLFTSVSPSVNEEFEVPYMSKIFSRFGAVYYGCCERLDDRLHIIDRMPNIRKISCSPWSDREHFAEVLPRKYVMSVKPTPAYLAQRSFDEEVVRSDLRRTIAVAKSNGQSLELLLKDITTVKNAPQRLWRWSEIAAEETLNSVL